jgi:hypothetical protein
MAGFREWATGRMRRDLGTGLLLALLAGLMFLAVFDRSVPAWTGRQLREAIGRPKTIYLLAGHYTSFIYLPYAQWESLCFVKRKFHMD